MASIRWSRHDAIALEQSKLRSNPALSAGLAVPVPVPLPVPDGP
jgi:hypothetical protein